MTSLRTTSINRPRRANGFTLIEIMIVLAILGGMLAVGLPRINRKQNNIKKVMRELGVLGKEVRDQARVKNMTQRLVFRMGRDESAYWVESAAGSIAGSSVKKLKGLNTDDLKKAEAESPFKINTHFFKEEKKMPKGLLIKSVSTMTDTEPIKEGKAYVYFSPEGMVEKSVIQVGNDQDLTWSLIYNPLTGHADIVEKAVEYKDLDQKF